MASLYKRNGVWYAAFVLDGRRVCRSTKTTRKPDALRFLSQFHDTPPKPRVASFSGFLQDFLAFSQSNHAPSSYRCYKRVCKDFLSFAGNVPIDAVGPVDIEKFKIARLKTVKPVSVNIELRMLKAAFGYAVKWGLIEKSPFKGASFVRISQQQPAFLAEGDVRKLLEVVDHPHLRDIILFPFTQACVEGR
jgi:site-specific recombinase XerD